jgi:hypothetical protein
LAWGESPRNRDGFPSFCVCSATDFVRGFSDKRGRPSSGIAQVLLVDSAGIESES